METNEPVQEHIKTNSVPFETENSEALKANLDLTPEEKDAAPLSAGVRGQIKKILRPYYDDHLSMRKTMDAFRQDVIDRANRAISRLDFKNKELYSGVVRWIVNDVGSSVSTTYVNLIALIDELTVRLHQLEAKDMEFSEYKKQFDEARSVRAKAIEADLLAKKKEQQQQNIQPEAKTQDTTNDQPQEKAQEQSPEVTA